MKTTLFAYLLLIVSSTSLYAQNQIDPAFFSQVGQFFSTYTKNNNVDYTLLKNKNQGLTNLIKTIEQAEISKLNSNQQKAFYINAYNLLVIHKVVLHYPINSVQQVPNFFDQKDIIVAGQKMSLNQLEKQNLLEKYKDPRLHFVLVCGAKDCPPIISQSYNPQALEQQLNAQTRKAIFDPNFIRYDQANSEVAISQIFKWYPKDFGPNTSDHLNYINTFRTIDKLSDDTKVKYYEYDWTLNNTTDDSTLQNSDPDNNNEFRYVVSAAIPKGTTESRLFFNLYTQKTNKLNNEYQARSTYFTSQASFIYGLTDRFNLGFDLRNIRVNNSLGTKSPFVVFEKTDGINSRAEFATLGPKIRFAPFRKLENFSIQSAFWIPLKDGLPLSPYIDDDGPTFMNQLFNDIPIGNKWSIFTEVDINIDDIGKDRANRFYTPVTLIGSFFPTPKFTIYAILGYAPYWEEKFDYFMQYGLGAKYQITFNFEIELLITDFTNKFLIENNGTAATFNLGVRYSK